jgi:hypothetical protein
VTFRDVLADMLGPLQADGVRPLVVGDLASALLARVPQGWVPGRIDLFLLPDEAERAAALLGRRGFESGPGREGWTYELRREGIDVDLAYRQPGDVYVDDDMLARAGSGSFEGVPLPLVSREDLVVLKALRHGEDRPWEWWDALAMIEAGGLDWEYLAERGRRSGGQRTLSLLAYARSLGLPVPDGAMDSLFGFLEERRAP